MKTITDDGLKIRYKKTIIETILRNKEVEKIVLFGSRATGMFTPCSDIDLVIFGSELTFDDQANIIENIKNLTVPYQVDVLIFHQIENNALLAEIKKDGVLWYKKMGLN